MAERSDVRIWRILIILAGIMGPTASSWRRSRRTRRMPARLGAASLDALFHAAAVLGAWASPSAVSFTAKSASRRRSLSWPALHFRRRFDCAVCRA